MSLAAHRVLPLVLLLLLASACVSGCVSFPGLARPTPTPAPAVTPSAGPVPTSPYFIPMDKPPATPTPVVTPEPSQLTVTSDVIFRPGYRWEYKDTRWNFTMVIPEDAYDYFRARPRTPGMSYADYALADEDRETLQDVARQIKSAGEGQGYSDYDNAMNVLTFVQSLPYASDIDSAGIAEYPRYPIETLKDGRGDCEDKTILAAALLQSMGMDVVILMMPDHSAVGIDVPGADGASCEHDGRRYYYCETTSGNWAIGEQPEELQGTAVRVVPMERSPILGLDLTVTSVSADHDNVYFRAQYAVKNAGPGTAKGLELRVLIYDPNAGESSTWQPGQTIRLGDIEEGKSTDGETMLTVPVGELAQVECLLSGDNVDTKKVMTEAFRAEK